MTDTIQTAVDAAKLPENSLAISMFATRADYEAELLVRRFHEAYERLAPSFGYKTNPDTREFYPSTYNGQLMVAVCKVLLAAQPQVAVPVVWRVRYPDDMRASVWRYVTHPNTLAESRVAGWVIEPLAAAPVAGQQDSAPLVDHALATNHVVAHKSGNMRYNAAQQSKVKP